MAIEFQDIAKLLNFSRTTHIDADPSMKGKDGRWALYQGTHKVHTSTFPFQVLYFGASASLQDIKAAVEQIGSLSNVDVVLAESLRKRFQGAGFEKVLNGAKGRWTAKTYFVSFIQDEIQTYLRKIAGQGPQDYINPKVETPAGFAIKTPNPLVSFLRDPETEAGAGTLGVLLAEPGQGKTYMSRYLVSILSRAGTTVVPLMVDSSQWHTMSIEDQRSLPKTIAHSFRHFGAPISWLEGHEDDFLMATLKADIFRLVFDGFDEYILRNRGSVQPLEVLDALADLAKKTGARIVITSRTSFWNTNLPEMEMSDFVKRHGALIFRICPFDLEHARNYFSQRLRDISKISRAVHIYQSIAKRDADFVGRGFVLSLIADLASDATDSSSAGRAGSGTMRWLMEALCERERLRQELPLTAEEQIGFLSTFAAEVAEGALPDTDLLSLSIALSRPTLDISSSTSIIEKLKSHPLIEQDAKSNHWSFRQEQIRVLLLTERLVRLESNELARFIQKAKLEPSIWQDLGETIVEILRRDANSEDEALERIARLLNMMSRNSDGSTRAQRVTNEGSRLPSIVALATVERFAPKGSPRADRAHLLVRLCGGSGVRDLNIRGTIAGFDFSNITFESCRFDRAGWANCRFNEQTSFLHCSWFGGVPPVQCDGLGSAVIVDPIFDPEAEAILSSVRVAEGRKKYCSDDLRMDIQSVVTKFVIKGGIGLKTVEANNLARGPIGASRHRDEILDVLKSTILEEHHISGATSGYNIRADCTEAVKFFAANNVFTGALRETFEKLESKLKLS